jgi:hypothetical protein
MIHIPRLLKNLHSSMPQLCCCSWRDLLYDKKGKSEGNPKFREKSVKSVTASLKQKFNSATEGDSGNLIF